MLHLDRVLEEVGKHSRRIQQNRKVMMRELEMAIEFIETSEEKFSDTGRTGIGSTRDAMSYLNGKTVCGVDGSQIEPSRENLVPLGGVQAVAINIEHGTGRWNRDVRFRITEWNEDVSLERFRLECSLAEDSMDGKRWVFFDGSLVLSFAGELKTSLRDAYITSMKNMLERSKDTGTPLVGVVDRSRARDAVYILSEISGFQFSHLVDSTIYSRILSDGEFSNPFPCRREVMGSYGGVGVYFMYLNSGGEIIRIEFPEWMVEMADKIAGVVYSECLLGKTRRYPYILERAHFHAVIRDREKLEFYRIVGGYLPGAKFSGKVGR